MTKKKHEKLDKAEKSEKEKTTKQGEGFFSEKNYALIFTALGALIIGVVIGILLNPTVVTPVPNPTDENKVGAVDGEITLREMTTENVSLKAKNFLDNSDQLFYANNLIDNGMEIEVTNVEKYRGLFYKIDFDIMKDEETQASLSVFTSLDGSSIFFSEPQNIEEPIEFNEPEPTPVEAQDLPKADKPEVKMFVMAYCPYGNEAEDGLSPVYRLLGEKIDFEPHFVYYGNYCGWGVKCTCDEGADETGMCIENPNYSEDSGARADYCFDPELDQPNYCSMHGVQELNEGIRETCAWKYDDHTKWWDYVDLVNVKCSPENIDTCWEEYAVQAGLDVGSIKSCFETEAESILATEVALSEAMGVQGSPSIFINDTSYSGGRAAENYKQGICSAFTEAPEECGQELGAAAEAATGSC